MSRISDLLETIRRTAGCTVLPPSGQPVIRPGLALPADLKEFYALAGGVRLFFHQGSSNRVVAPEDFRQADDVICGTTREDGPEAAWYAVADVQDGNYLLIDLDPQRLGKCYDAFHETYAMREYMAVVAGSFTEMLERLYGQGDNRSYWLRDDFHPAGDAYDLLNQ